ncbi:MAG: DUF559 domain-containing protein [Betaproteobacteria bacterium]|nr:DUF559 domain-containing protein [Betaproteobacteria bacterium]
MSIVVEPFVRTIQQDTAAHTSAHRHIDRQLRAAAERTLWQHLQDCRLGGAKFRRQHLVDLYLADFVCMDARLVIELCSTLTPSLALHASTRRAFFHAQGFQVLRLRDRDVLVDTRAVLDTIRQALQLSPGPRAASRTGPQARSQPGSDTSQVGSKMAQVGSNMSQPGSKMAQLESNTSPSGSNTSPSGSNTSPPGSSTSPRGSNMSPRGSRTSSRAGLSGKSRAAFVRPV